MSARLIFLFTLSLCLTACGSKTPAPAVHHGQSSGAGSAGVHTVLRGDTLYSLSSRYRLPMRDIAVLNRMKPPFKLTEGQRIKLPPPQEYKVQGGDTLYGVSRMFSVNSSEVARLNNVNSPYILKPGQVLRLPSVIRKTASVKSKSVQSTTLAKSEVAPVERTVLAQPAPKPKPAVIKDGVPIPNNKPMKTSKPKPVKITKVTSKTPKRSSSKFLRPVRGKMISSFGAKKNGLHNDGINIAAARGTSVKAAENGVVVYAGNALKGSGNLVLVRHEGQWMTAYAHLDTISVRKGQTLKRGAVIGTVGSTGSVSTPQLHFEVRRGTSALNPVKYMG